MAKARRHVVSFSVPASEADLIDRIQSLADLERTSFSTIMRRAAREYLEKHGTGNPQTTLPGSNPGTRMSTPANVSMKGHLQNIRELVRLNPGTPLNQMVADYSVTWGFNEQTIRKYVRMLDQAGRLSLRKGRLYAA